MTTNTFAAVDLGASSGRVIRATLAPGSLELTEVQRFAYHPTRGPGGLLWDIRSLISGVREGLGRVGRVDSIGIDSWAVDYGLIDGSGAMLGAPFCYRDDRTAPVIEQVHAKLSPAELYEITGVQYQPFNTIYQLAAEDRRRLERADKVLLIPDLVAYQLTGKVGAEVTNASTTGLFDVRSRTWSHEVMDRVGIPWHLLPELREPGSGIGSWDGTPVVAVGSHDTASAVAGVPAEGPDFAYICSGTWSLAGLELDAPVLSDAARSANFTNELGVDGKIRFLRNIAGLWLLTECQREWSLQGAQPDLPSLIDAARAAKPLTSLIDAGAAEFLAPGGMPNRIAEYCRRTGQPPPKDTGALVRCILESLALAHRTAIRTACALTGRKITAVHLVGGGSRNDLLCQLTADATGLPVIAGPAEATAIGNVLMQARAAGLLGGLAEARALIAATQPLRHFEPGGNESAWDEAAARAGLS